MRQNGDTMPGINSSFMDVAARLGKPLAFEPEFGMDNISDLAHDVLSWGYWSYTPAASLAPAVSSYKFVENRCENNYVQTMGVQLFLRFAFDARPEPVLARRSLSHRKAAEKQNETRADVSQAHGSYLGALGWRRWLADGRHPARVCENGLFLSNL